MKVILIKKKVYILFISASKYNNSFVFFKVLA